MEVLCLAILVPLEPLLWAQKADMCLALFPGMVCLMASSLFVYPFWVGHLKKPFSEFLGGATPNESGGE